MYFCSKRLIFARHQLRQRQAPAPPLPRALSRPIVRYIRRAQSCQANTIHKINTVNIVILNKPHPYCSTIILARVSAPCTRLLSWQSTIALFAEGMTQTSSMTRRSTRSRGSSSSTQTRSVTSTAGMINMRPSTNSAAVLRGILQTPHPAFADPAAE